jgi:hypothetical protein
MSQRDCNGITQRDNTSPVAVASGRERPCKGLLLPIRTDAENTVKEIATGYTRSEAEPIAHSPEGRLQRSPSTVPSMAMIRQALERLAVEAHHRGDTWGEFWPGVAAAVGQTEPWDNVAYRRLVARLSHLLTCGDTGGMVPIDTGWERPAAWELEAIEAAAVAAHGVAVHVHRGSGQGAAGGSEAPQTGAGAYPPYLSLGFFFHPDDPHPGKSAIGFLHTCETSALSGPCNDIGLTEASPDAKLTSVDSPLVTAPPAEIPAVGKVRSTDIPPTPPRARPAQPQASSTKLVTAPSVPSRSPLDTHPGPPARARMRGTVFRLK